MSVKLQVRKSIRQPEYIHTTATRFEQNTLFPFGECHVKACAIKNQTTSYTLKRGLTRRETDPVLRPAVLDVFSKESTTHVSNAGPFHVAQVTSWSACNYRRCEKPILEGERNPCLPITGLRRCTEVDMRQIRIPERGWTRDEARRCASVG
jgi:hypothetical protein